MGAVVGALAIGLMVIVLAIAIFSLIVTATIPVGRFLERRRARSQDDEDTGSSQTRSDDAS